MNASELKKKISRLSDEELKSLIVGIAESYGIDRSKIRKLTDDIPKTRRTVMLLSDKQIAGLLSSLGNSGNGKIPDLGFDLR